MKKYIYLFLLASVFASCTTTQYVGTYKMKLKSVDRGGVASRVDSSGLVYEDSLIKAAWEPTEKMFGLQLENKSIKNFQIIWNDGAMVIGNKSDRVFHSGVQYMKATDALPPTTVVHGTNMREWIAPAQNVTWIPGTKNIDGHWISKSIFVNAKAKSMDAAVKQAAKYVGQEILLSLPVKQGDNTTEYTFTFLISGVTVKKEEVKPSVDDIMLGCGLGGGLLLAIPLILLLEL